MPLPRILKNMNLFADGESLHTAIEAMTVPNLALKMDEHRAGGMDMPIEIDMGMEKMELSFQISDPNERVLGLIGLPRVQFMARSAHQRDGEDAEPMTVSMTGTLKQIELGEFKSGEKAMHTFNVALIYYRLNMAGTDKVEIDPINMIRRIDGTDVMTSIRSAIGM
ncbi:MAG: phage major tail tube protein [Cyanobacteria bacterium J06638_7]